jgi:2-dehydropantoate 2-reductase
VARIGSHISEPGVVKQIGTFARLEFGEPDGRPSARTAALLEVCTLGGIDAALSPNIRREVWLKFAMLAPVAGMTALTRGPIGPVRANAESRRLLQAAVAETVAVGMALKTGLVPADTDDAMRFIDGIPTQMMASMAHDLMAGKPLELDGLSGAVVRLGRRCSVPTPTHAFIAGALAPFADGSPLPS